MRKTLLCVVFLPTFCSRSADRHKFASESARVSKALGNELARFIGFTALEHHEQVIALLSLAFAAFISVGLRSTKGL